MKGIVFNLLEEFVIENWGEETYEAVLDSAQLETQEPFVGPGTYPDADLVELLVKTCEKVGAEAPDALRAFGKFCFPKLAEVGAVFLEGHDHPKSFLLSVHDVIHVEVRKLYEHANPPEFAYEDPGDGQLVMAYRSKRNLCAFMEGLLQGTGDFFETPIEFKKTTCRHDGADWCRYELAFAPARTAAAE